MTQETTMHPLPRRETEQEVTDPPISKAVCANQKTFADTLTHSPGSLGVKCACARALKPDVDVCDVTKTRVRPFTEEPARFVVDLTSLCPDVIMYNCPTATKDCRSSTRKQRQEELGQEPTVQDANTRTRTQTKVSTAKRQISSQNHLSPDENTSFQLR